MSKDLQEDRDVAFDPAQGNLSKESKGTPKKRKIVPQSEKDPKFTASELARLKSLFLVKGAGPNEIADKLNRNPKTVSQWIYRLKLVDKRKALSKRIEEKELAKASSDIERTLESIKSQSEELVEDTFQLARDTIKEEPNAYKAKNLQAYSIAARNFTTMFRESAGIAAGANPAPSNQFNVFLMPAVAKPEPKQADPVEINDN